MMGVEQSKVAAESVNALAIETVAQLMVDANSIAAQVNAAMSEMVADAVTRICRQFDLSQSQVVAEAVRMQAELKTAVIGDHEGSEAD